MQIIDNINHLLGDDLKQTLKPGAKLKIAASCFSMYAYEALRTELEQIDSLQFIFTAPTFPASEVAAYKRPALSSDKPDPEHWVHSSHFGTAWLPSDTPKSVLPGALDLSGLYETLLRQLIPLVARRRETLTEQVERVAQVAIIQREADHMASRLAKEKQFNRKVEINQALRKLKNELQELMT